MESYRVSKQRFICNYINMVDIHSTRSSKIHTSQRQKVVENKTTAKKPPDVKCSKCDLEALILYDKSFT